MNACPYCGSPPDRCGAAPRGCCPDCSDRTHAASAPLVRSTITPTGEVHARVDVVADEASATVAAVRAIVAEFDADLDAEAEDAMEAVAIVVGLRPPPVD